MAEDTKKQKLRRAGRPLRRAHADREYGRRHRARPHRAGGRGPDRGGGHAQHRRLLALLGLKKPCVAYHEHKRARVGRTYPRRAEGGEKLRGLSPTRVRPPSPTRASSSSPTARGRACASCRCLAHALRSARCPARDCPAAGSPSRAFCPTKRASASAILPVCASIRIRSFSISRRTMRQRDLADLYRALGDRRAALCRELTSATRRFCGAAGRAEGLPFTIRGEGGARRGGRVARRIVGVAVGGGARRALRRAGDARDGRHPRPSPPTAGCPKARFTPA